MGVIGLVKLAGTLAFAVPLALYGLERVHAGHELGWAFLGLALLMVAAERYVTTPFDLPERAAEEAADAVVDDED